jgi:DNA ligase (NAD+)
VTQNIMQISNIPQKISYKDHLEVRWEVVMPISSFEDLNKKAKQRQEKIFSNPRNAASWSVRMKDNRITKKRNLKFFAYDLANFSEFSDKENIDKYYDVIISLKNLGFEISSYFKKLKWISKVIDSIKNFWNLKNTLDFEIDWLVIKVNDLELWEQIGWTEHHPRYAISYKFPAEIFTTKIISVDHQVWRTGTITPVANLEPVNMWWAIIRRATLHNYEEVENLWVKVWDNVFIKRAWEVIPKIISVCVSNSWKKIVPPEFCPGCETEVIKDEDKVRYYCPNNLDCPLKHHEKLVFAVGKNWFDIDGFWEKQVELFLKEWIIHNLVDIFKIEEKKEEILEFEWFKEKSVQNLINWVEKAKKMDISTLLTSLWIHWVWKKTAKTLAKLFKNKDDLLNFSFNVEDLEELSDIWGEIATNVIEYFQSDAHMRILKDLSEILDIKYYEEKIIDSDSIFSQKKVCITWSFIWDDGKKISRDRLIESLENVWGIFVSSVSKNTDFLVAWEKAGSKLKKAQDFDIEILDLRKFNEFIK